MIMINFKAFLVGDSINYARGTDMTIKLYHLNKYVLV